MTAKDSTCERCRQRNDRWVSVVCTCGEKCAHPACFPVCATHDWTPWSKAGIFTEIRNCRRCAVIEKREVDPDDE